MKTITVAEFKTNLSTVMKQILAGEEFIVTHGRRRTQIFRASPVSPKKAGKRKLGIMKGRAKASFSRDFKITTEEFLGL
ncbi:MAG: type II toxin-antitoxin system Phd/YefM family antitoxin [Cyclobacteriaceae bacterium]|jgi:antitoxin (DNA-binding transcriptional repressor) of toxin-antitoxin stability system